jgi:methyltransferase
VGVVCVNRHIVWGARVGGYDVTVGTSERGECVPSCELKFLPSCRHLLIVIGGPEGLEVCLKNDPWATKHASPAGLFDRWLNTCAKQGSRTIRTEEAILISMAYFQPAIDALLK